MNMSGSKFAKRDRKKIIGTALPPGKFPNWIPHNIVKKVRSILSNGIINKNNLPQPYLFKISSKNPYLIIFYFYSETNQINAEVTKLGPYTKQNFKNLAQQTNIPLNKLLKIYDNKRAWMLHFIFREELSIEEARIAVREKMENEFPKAAKTLLGLMPFKDFKSIPKPLNDVNKIHEIWKYGKSAYKTLMGRDLPPQSEWSISDGLKYLKLTPNQFLMLLKSPLHVHNFYPNWVSIDNLKSDERKSLISGLEQLEVFNYLSSKDTRNNYLINVTSPASISDYDISKLFKKWLDIFGRRPYIYNRMLERVIQLERKGYIKLNNKVGSKKRKVEILKRSKICVPFKAYRYLQLKKLEYYGDYSDERIKSIHTHSGNPDNYYEFLISLKPKERESFINSTIIPIEINWEIIEHLSRN